MMNHEVEQYRPRVSQKLWMNPEFKEKLVTVIITTYQRADYIIQTANSIFNQTYRPIELIIIDDGSYDNTKEKLDEWVSNLPKKIDFDYKYIFQENSGAPAARNLALLMSNGEYIQEVGSDDLLHFRKLELHINSLEQNADCQSAWSPLLRFKNDEEEKVYNREYESEFNEIVEVKKMTSNLFIPQFLPSAALHRREVFYKTGPWLESLTRWQDLEYQIRMGFCLINYTVIDQPLYYFRQHDGVRINSQYKDISGLESGFIALKAIERNVNIFNINNKVVNLEISRLYFTLAELAARNNLVKELSVAVKGALRNRKDIKFYFRIRLFQVLSILFGGKFSVWVTEFYTKSIFVKSLSFRKQIN